MWYTEFCIKHNRSDSAGKGEHMSFKKDEFLSYIKNKGLKSGRSYCSCLCRTERQLGYDIDTEYKKDACVSLSDKLKTEFDKSKSNDRKLHRAIGRMRTALKKYIEFQNDLYIPSDTPTLDWSVKDTMVGTVRDSRQLEFILKFSGYYVPAHFITDDRLPIRYIALHEQGIGSEPGIRRYGEVLTAQKIKRSRIPVPMSRSNGDELYFYFQVRCWVELSQPINIRDTSRGKPLFTNKFLLDNCTESYQLFSVSSAEDFRLIAAINKAFDDLRNSQETENHYAAYPINKTYTLIISQGYFSVVNDRGEALERISVGSFSYKPKDGFNKMKKVVENQEDI